MNYEYKEYTQTYIYIDFIIEIIWTLKNNLWAFITANNLKEDNF